MCTVILLLVISQIPQALRVATIDTHISGSNLIQDILDFFTVLMLVKT